jgi:hypothetical protein
MKPNRAIYFQKGEDYEPLLPPPVKPPRSTETVLIERRELTVGKRRREEEQEDPLADFQKAKADLKGLPIYLISAHSCLVPIGIPCFRERPDPSFEIPADTYVLSFSQANDLFCGSDQIDKLIIRNRESIREYLYMHDTNDVLDHPLVGETHFSLFTGLTRATSSTEEPTPYPNIAFTFNSHDVTDELNPYGVYCIDSVDRYEGLATLNNTKSIIRENHKRNNFMLKDIIQEVYKATGSNKGIFISTGCLHVYPSSSSTKKIARESARFAGNLIHIANNYYRTLRPTWTKEEMASLGQFDKVPLDIPTRYPVTAMDPVEVMEMEHDELLDALHIVEEMPFLLADKEDRDKVLKTVSRTSPSLQP